MCGKDLLLGNFKNHGDKLEQLDQDVGSNVAHDLVRLIHKRTDDLGVGAVLAGDGSAHVHSLASRRAGYHLRIMDKHVVVVQGLGEATLVTKGSCRLVSGIQSTSILFRSYYNRD